MQDAKFQDFNWDPQHPQKTENIGKSHTGPKKRPQSLSNLKFFNDYIIKFIKQRKTSEHCYTTISLIANIAECLPFGICTNLVKLTTLVEYVFPQRGSDQLQTERAGSWCLFYFSTFAKVKKLQKEINYFRLPFC